MNTAGLTVIRLSDFSTIKTISTDDLGGYPRFIAVSPMKSEAYVLIQSHGGNQASNFATTTQLGNPDAPMAAAEVEYLIQVVDTATNTVVGPATQLPHTSNQIAVTPDGSEVYAAMTEGVAYVTVADHLPHTIAGLSDSSQGMAIRSNGATVCTISRNSSEDYVLTRINPLSHTFVQDPIPSDFYPSGFLSISPDGKTAYVTGFSGQGGSPEAIPAATFANIAIMDVSGSGASPTTLYANVEGLVGIAITPDQAPTARFTTSLNSTTVTFDASTSDSPVGTVVLYDWDFGDGQTQSTTSPTISHTYSNGGTYNVTLTVTNSAGTSTEVTFTGQTVSNEGGPSAIHTEAIAVSSPAPTHFQGRVVLHHKHNHKTRRADLKTSWHHSKSTTVKQYEIFARNKRVAKIPVFSNTAKTLRLDPHHFPNHVSKKYRLYLHNNYKIRAVAIDGTASSFTNLKVKH
jgi:PKD repeat protein